MLRYRWFVELVDEDPYWYLSARRSQLRQDVRGNIVVADDVVVLETIELALKLAHFHAVCIHVLPVAIPGVVDLIDDHQGVAVDQETLDAKRYDETEPM